MKKIVALIICLFMCFSLAACSFSWDKQTSITSASVVYDEKADKYYLELVYESGDVSRIEVTDLSALRGDSGSKGDKGDNGNGIAEIITKNNGTETEVTIKFTSEEMKDVTFFYSQRRIRFQRTDFRGRRNARRTLPCVYFQRKYRAERDKSASR